MSDDEGFEYYEDEPAAGLEDGEAPYGAPETAAASAVTAAPSMKSPTTKVNVPPPSKPFVPPPPSSGVGSKPPVLTSTNLKSNTYNAPAVSPRPMGGVKDPQDDTDRQARVEIEVAKRLLQTQVTATVQRYDTHMSFLMSHYFSSVDERRLLYASSRALAAPLLPFGGGDAEERSASVRFERMLMASSKATEIELNSFRKQCMELRTDWQKQFMAVCQRASESERKRKDDYLNILAISRKEVDATATKMKAEFANKAVELAELEELRSTVEVLKEEATATREALQEARRQAVEDRSRHFKEREKLIADYGRTLHEEREKFSVKIRELDQQMESERSQHLSELSAAAHRHSRAMSEVSLQLSDTRDQNSHYLSDASVARGEALAEKRAFSEERTVLQTYIRALESAFVEIGGRIDAIPSSRSAAAYMSATTARKELLTNGGASGGGYAGYGSPQSFAIPSHSSHRRGGSAVVAAAFDSASPRTATGAAIRQSYAIGVVDEMLGMGVSSGRAPASLLPRDHNSTIDDVAGRPSFLSQLRSPSANLGGGGHVFSTSARARSASPNSTTVGYHLNTNGFIHGSPPYRQPMFASPSQSAVERSRTIRNQGGPTAMGYSPSASFSSRR